MRHLYEISSEYADFLEFVYDSAEDGDGEIPPDQTDRLDCLSGEFTEKVDACCRVLKDLQASQEVCKAEADRLATRARRIGKNADWLKNYVKECLERAQVTKVDAGPFRVRIQNNPESVEVVSLDLVPHTFDVEQERKISLTAIKEQLKAGVDVPGVALKRGTHLRIS